MFPHQMIKVRGRACDRTVPGVFPSAVQPKESVVVGTEKGYGDSARASGSVDAKRIENVQVHFC